MIEKLNRRSFLKATGASATVGSAALAGCTGDGSGGTAETTASDGAETDETETTAESEELSDTLNFYSWGGSTQEALNEHVIEPFEEEYGVTVKQSSFGGQDKMLANVRSSPEGSYDVIMPSTATSYAAAKQGLVEPLRLENIETWSNLMPVFEDFSVDPGESTHVAPLYYGTIGMGYNSDYVDDSNGLSWDLAFDEEFAGQVAIEGVPYVRVFTTALKLGMDPNEMVGDAGSYEEGVKQVYDAMAEQHELVKKYWTSGQELTSLFSNETAYVGEAWGGRILSLQDEGYDNLKYGIPEEGAYGFTDTLAIAKGSKNRYTAEKFIEFAYRDDVITNLAPDIGYPPATEATSSDVEALPDFDPSGGERLTFQDQAFKNEHQQEWSRTFEQIKLGNY
ncbi:ABC transporter substrate-binding protein [Haloferax denitrificans]|uniref:Spermidine/putrescine ABC transporter substrate-binding protein n=1 Tax=Haloferax denitrificans ATCC 35960 TaxID=662478 RepID=M0J5X2_9EURY|nr:PotD/PotF family extracellular solute-binding protein [Haloferax denitrificans]EMA03105.1 spermidine/putrescine ABC transporter substrate-binding protein [Haloferax denitrificans ATCC 35960]